MSATPHGADGSHTAARDVAAAHEPAANLNRSRELEYLRERVAELEAELVNLEAWAGRAVAQAQEKTYWLERWHVDLNALMRQRWTHHLRASLRMVRAVFRRARQGRRRLST